MAGLALACWIAWPRSQAAQDAAPKSASPQELQVQGVASCASMACHHQNGPKGSKGSEYTTWITHDKHARAYQVLFDERSKIIERNYRGLTDLKESHPEKDALCLGCHVQPNIEAQPKTARFSLEDGVGCESCHGPAQKWRTEHYLREWKDKTPAEKEALGMRDTKNLLVRVKLCVECHVGSSDLDVNHDLIAAGHPRLNFEFSSYQAIMPKHWNERDDKTRYPDFEARAWLFGQLVCARAALDLLAHRAEPAKKPWPEFAEYDCFACHHDLREPSWRQKRGYNDQLPGSLPWADWYYAMLFHALDFPDPNGHGNVLTPLAELKKEMGKPYPDAKRVSNQARDVAGRLNQRLEKLEQVRLGAAVSFPAMFAALKGDDKRTQANWDTAAQRYLGMTAVYQTLGDLKMQRDPKMKDELQDLRKRLQFPPGYDSPRDYRPLD